MAVEVHRAGWGGSGVGDRIVMGHALILDVRVSGWMNEQTIVAQLELSPNKALDVNHQLVDNVSLSTISTDLTPSHQTCRALHNASHCRTVCCSIAHVTHTVSSPQPSPSTQCLHNTSNQPHSCHGTSPCSWTLHRPTPSSPHTRVFDPYGGVLVDEDEDDCSEIVFAPGGGSC